MKTPAQRAAIQNAHCKREYIRKLANRLHTDNTISTEFGIKDDKICQELEDLRSHVRQIRYANLVTARECNRIYWRMAKHVYGILKAQKNS